jgi:hypothetical protein
MHVEPHCRNRFTALNEVQADNIAVSSRELEISPGFCVCVGVRVGTHGLKCVLWQQGDRQADRVLA